jgi:hypothetical protein
MQAPKCEVCRNEYDKAFQISIQGRTHTFDSFECAIEALAPRCAHCHVRIVGHGMENGSQTFCSASCASAEGVGEMRDRA